MKRLSRCFLSGIGLVILLSSGGEANGAGRPNVLFLVVDDMRDWVGCLGGYPGEVKTPNIDRLAGKGVLFTNAHCPAPKCAPSRAATMTGLRPSTTGLYDNGHWWYPNLPDVVTIPAHFRAHGYRTVGAGKIFHHTAGNHPPNQWDHFQPIRFNDDPWFRSSDLNYPWTAGAPFPAGYPFSGVEGLPHENDWGAIPRAESDYDDRQTADYAVRFLENFSGEQPFFLASGLFRPHLPWYVPQRFLDLYPLATVRLPHIKEGDLSDVPSEGRALARARRSDFERIQAAGKWREAVRAYLASISYADDLLGRVLDALERSGTAENTVVVLWSDHGLHLGEKEHWHKSTLWEAATRVPLIIAAPNYARGRCQIPVSLVDIYPTLIELCGLSSIEQLDGESLVSMLKAPGKHQDRAAVTEFRRGNATLRTGSHRYTHYSNDGQELYNHLEDPHEWHNLIEEPEGQGLARLLSRHLPDSWAPSAPTKAAYSFDPESFTWTEKKSGRVISGR